MKSIKLLKRQAIKAAQISFKSGKLDEPTAKKFIKAFKTLPLHESIIILNHFRQAVKREINKTTLTIDSVITIPKSDIRELEASFKREFKIIEIKEELDPSLLGGIKVRIGDVIFDNSLRLKVAQIGNVLKN